MPANQRKALIELKANLENDSVKLKKTPNNLPTSLSPNFLNDAKTINFEELNSVLGEDKFKEYLEGQREAQGVLHKRGKEMDVNKRSAPYN